MASSTTSPPSSAQTDKSSASISSGTTSSSNNRLPTLSDIAARMKLDSHGSASTAPTSAGSDASAHLPAPARGRLGLAGRLNSAGASDVDAQGDGPVPDSADSQRGPTLTLPEAVAQGTPPRASAQGGGTRSRSVSPVKRSIPPGASGTGSKTLPSLKDIRERMSKKGLQTPGGAARADAPAEKEQSPPVQTAEAPAPAVADAPAPTAEEPKLPDIAPASAQRAKTPYVPPSLAAKKQQQQAEPPSSSAASASAASPAPSTESKAPRSAASHGSSPPSSAPAAKEDEKPKEKGHPLQHKWTLYFDSKSFNPSTVKSPTSSVSTPPPSGSFLGPPTPGYQPSSPGVPPTTPGGSLQANNWEAALKLLGNYTTVEGFMSIFATLRRPSQLERNSNYHLFKDGIKPMWEDPANANGGKWILTMRGTTGALLDRSWMWLVLALIGEELDDQDDICGAVVSTRPKGDRIALWLRTKDDVDRVNRLGKKLVHLLNVEREPGVTLEFTYNSGPPAPPPSAAAGAAFSAQSSMSRFVHFSNPPPPPMPAFQGQAGYGGGSTSGSASSTRTSFSGPASAGPDMPAHGSPGKSNIQLHPHNMGPPSGGPGRSFGGGGGPHGSPGAPIASASPPKPYVMPRRGSEQGQLGSAPGLARRASEQANGQSPFNSLSRHGQPPSHHHQQQQGVGLGLGGPIGRSAFGTQGASRGAFRGGHAGSPP